MDKKPNVLFLCTGNACRSQMAEGWAKALKSHEYNAFSAGTNPHGKNPLAVKVMSEAGIDIAGQESKHIDQLSPIEFDLVVTVCDSANESCPVLPGNTKKIHHSFEDPPKLAAHCNSEDEALPFYRKVRDEIKAYIETTKILK